MKFGEQKIELRLSALAAERIEEKFDKPLDEIFTTELKLKATDVSFILWSMALTDHTLDEFKAEMAKYYTYSESIAAISEVLNPNAEAASAIETGA
jgi:hypothetical protein